MGSSVGASGQEARGEQKTTINNSTRT